MSDPFRFVICPPYHGATALAFLLNNHPRLSCLGDTLPWTAQNQSCSCGSRVEDCAFWQEIQRRVHASRWQGEQQMLPLLPRLVGAPRLNRALARALVAASLVFGHSARRLAPRPVTEFCEVYQDFYDSVLELHGTEHVVDGSKSLGKILALTGLGEPGQRARVLHLTRDPRGYAASLANRGVAPADIGAVGSEWRRTHRRIERLLSRPRQFDYLRIRYEDLCQTPDRTMGQVLRFFGVEPVDVFHPAREPCKNHIIGNRMLKSFDGVLRLDERWRTVLGAGQQDAVLARAAPLAADYGYR